MRGSRKFCQKGGPTLTVFLCVFLVDEGRIQISLKAGHNRCWPNIECWLRHFVFFSGYPDHYF